MGFLASFIENGSYAWAALKLPFTITVWQHSYNMTPLLIIQETADAYGLLCVSVIFLSAQIFSRNSMLSIFLRSLTNSNRNSADNQVKPLSTNTSAATQLLYLLASSISMIKSKMRL